MNRVVIERSKEGLITYQLQHLSKQASGNGAQRRKQLKSGWKPVWVNAGHTTDQLTALAGLEAKVEPLAFGTTEIIQQAQLNQLQAADYIKYAHDIVEDINNTLYGEVEEHPNKTLRLVWE